MKIIIEDLPPGEEETITVRVHTLKPELMRMLHSFRAQSILLLAHQGNEIHRISPSDIYYIDTVENKTVLHAKDELFESKQKLYELEESLAEGDFLRISKSSILNLRKVKSLVPAFSGRLEAVLRNGERVPISRHYVPELKKVLGI
jgi:DNA-binding LytR/AlgR family response regulator